MANKPRMKVTFSILYDQDYGNGSLNKEELQKGVKQFLIDSLLEHDMAFFINPEELKLKMTDPITFSISVPIIDITRAELGSSIIIPKDSIRIHSTGVKPHPMATYDPSYKYCDIQVENYQIFDALGNPLVKNPAEVTRDKAAADAPPTPEEPSTGYEEPTN